MFNAGLQLPNFTIDGPPERIFPAVSEVAVAAEEGGFDALMVMDHFYQLPLMGQPDEPMMEAYTLLGGIAARTSRAQLGTLVTGVTYRNPALLAKILTTLDHISGGRAFLGIGAAWFDVEHEGLGFEFPSVSERFERLEEALQICRAMFDGERITFEGQHYSTKEAINSPAPLHRIPIMIGGSGEKKTLRMGVQYGDMINLTAGKDELARKLEVIGEHCERLGRDRTEINVSMLGFCIAGATHEAANDKRDAILARMGLPPWAELGDDMKGMIGDRMFVGGPDELAEQFAAVRDAGLDSITVNLPADGLDPEAAGVAGQIVSKAFS